MPVVLLFAIIVLTLMFSPLWIWGSEKERAVGPLDWAYPYAPIGFWILLTALGVGAQSFSNLIEIPIIAGLSWLLYLSVLRTSGDHRRNVLLALTATMVLALALRLFMPLLPE